MCVRCLKNQNRVQRRGGLRGCSSSPAQALGYEGSKRDKTHLRPQPSQHQTHLGTHRMQSGSRPGTRAPGAGSGTEPLVRWSPALRPGLPPGDLQRKKRTPSEQGLTARQPTRSGSALKSQPLARRLVQQHPCTDRWQVPLLLTAHARDAASSPD